MINQEAIQERADLLNELLASRAWQQIVVPVLSARLQELQRRAMSAATIEDLRQFQGSHRVLSEILTDPTGFFATKESS